MRARAARDRRRNDDAIAVFGCGPVGQFTIASARLRGAGRIFAVGTIASRLEMARAQGAEVIDFNAEDPVETLRRLTGGIGVDRAIDAVGVDAVRPECGPAAKAAKAAEKQFEQELREVAPKTNPVGGNWHPGDAPSQVLQWAMQALAKAGTLALIGVYPEAARSFPIGTAMNKNLTIQMGNCNHRKYTPMLVDLVRTGEIDPLLVLTQREPLGSAIEAYQSFDRREPGWTKVELQPQAAAG
jgi:threonine dehydrogenase-like Zn-dependent dehydrogenase